MGSMAEVMKKLRGDPGESSAALPPTRDAETPVLEAPAEGIVDVVEPDLVEAVMESDPPIPPPAEPVVAVSATRFAAESHYSGDTPLPAETTNWDRARVDSAVVAFHDRYSSVCEQFRAVRARLLSMNAGRGPRVIAITSSMPREGKSVTTLNLGLVMAEGGEQRTLVVDADFRRASIGRMLGLPPAAGLAELIRGAAPLRDVLQPSPLPNLKIMTPGQQPGPGYAELFGASAAREALEQLRGAFDYVFLDMPPVNTVADVSLLAPHCDGVILVVEMRRTPEPAAQQAVRSLQANNVKILGCVLSRHDDRRKHYYDRYSYYYRAD